jgi:signal transduction histidine kinase
LARAHGQLTHYAGNLERLTASRERNRVARELHDTLAHSLSGLAVQLEAARSVWRQDSDKARALVDRAQVTARDGLQEVRRALQALRASPLEDLGLMLAIRHLVEGMRERTGCAVELDLPDPPVLSSDAAEQGVFRIVQEALDNIERHAGATHVTVLLAVHGQSWRLVISDDGRGFDTSGVETGRHGLQGIRERAELLGGTAAWETSPGHGTRLLVTADSAKERAAP